MTEHLGSGAIIKLGLVTHDADRTAAALAALFPPGPVPASQSATHPPFSIEPFKRFRGQSVADIPLKVVNVYTENFWFEVVEPLDDTPSPWREQLDRHGTGACFVTIHIDGGLGQDVTVMEGLGFPEIFREDKGYERYAYFDTTADLGFLVEVKERLAK
jgi:hypothetical protein